MRILTRRQLLQKTGAPLLFASPVLASGACLPRRGADAPDAGKAPAGPPVTIYWTAWGGAERIEQYRSQADRFTQASPSIVVEFIPQTGDYNEKVMAMLASSTQLDVARIDAYFMASYVDR